MWRIETRLRHALAALVLGSLAVAAAAAPRWMLVGETDGVRVYIDTSQNTHPPGYLRLWTLLDYPRLQRGGWRSEQRLFLFSCKDRTFDWQQSIYFAANMAEGSPVDLHTPRRDAEQVSLLGRKKRLLPEAEFVSVLEGMC